MLLKFSGGKHGGPPPSAAPVRPGDVGGTRILESSYKSPWTHVSEKGEEATDGDGMGALPVTSRVKCQVSESRLSHNINLSLPGMDGMPEGKENSNCCGSSNGNENEPRSLPARLVVVPPMLALPTILAWPDGPAEREVRGCPRMSPSRSK